MIALVLSLSFAHADVPIARLERVEQALAGQQPKSVERQCRRLRKHLPDVPSVREELAALQCITFGQYTEEAADRLSSVLPDGPVDVPWKAVAVGNLLPALDAAGRYAEARVWSARLVTYHREHAADSEELVWALAADSRMRTATRDPDSALAVIDEALALAQVVGVDPVSRGLLHAERAYVLHELTRMEDAVAEQVLAVEWLAGALGEHDPHVLNERGDLALMRVDAGDIETARREYAELRAEVEALWGPDAELAIAIALGQVHLLDESRDFTEALVQVRALHERTAATLPPTGELALEIGVAHAWVAVHAEQFDEAIAVLAPMERALEPHSDDPRLTYRRAQVLFLLSGSHREAGSIDEAVEVGLAADALATSVLPAESGVLGGFRSGLANTLVEAGRYDDALAVLDALPGAENGGRAFGEATPRLRAVAMHRLARDEDARPLIDASIRASLERLDGLSGMVDDGARRQAADSLRRAMGLYLRVHDRPDEATVTWATALALKGIARRALIFERERRDASPEIAALHDALRARRARLAEHAFGEVELAPERVQALSEEARDLELRLVESSRGWRHARELVSVDPAAVCARLRPDEVLVDFVVADGHWTEHDDWLVAWVVHPDCSVERVDIHDAPGVAKSVAWHRSMLELPTADAMLTHMAGATVRQRLWDPLVPLLREAKTVVVVPDGVLAEVSFATLPHSEGFLVEDYGFRYLESALDLVRERPVTDAHSALVAGVSEFSAVASACATDLPPLDGVEMELDMVAGRLRAAGLDVRAVPEVDVAAMRDGVAGQRIVHLASHGYFPEAACAERPEDPLLASGLVLSDGVWPARAVALADLRSADLVVLSACSSGSGVTQPGEGVLGLRRGFAAAGAGTLVMSLWSVDDLATGELMDWFYEALLDDGLPPAEAMRTAQLRGLEDGRVRGDAWPGAWGAFIVAGR